MNKSIYSIVTGTGSYIPENIVKNEAFLNNKFLESNGEEINKSNEEITDKFLNITTIAERRYVSDEINTSDIAFFAAEKAIISANIDKEDLDCIIVAHNFGEIKADKKNTDLIPSIAARVKFKLGIENPSCVSYDLIFGCPGWLQGLIQADYLIKSGDAKKVLIIGAEILSRVADPHDRDCMIYSDGAGATILEAKESESPIGIIAHSTRSDTKLYSKMLYMGPSFNKDDKDGVYMKMNGRRLYMYALETVPNAIKACLEKSSTSLSEIKKVLIHQANGKMDDAILERLYKLHDNLPLPKDIMPMTIQNYGNSSVATIPTLLDLIEKNKLAPHKIESGDKIIFASVGAGMNANAVVYITP